MLPLIGEMLRKQRNKRKGNKRKSESIVSEFVSEYGMLGWDFAFDHEKYPI